MRAPAGADKENIPADGSPSKTTPRPQRISWSHANQHHPYSTAVRDLPSSGKRRDPQRSILKKTPHIIPMQALAPEPCPDVEEVLADESYLLSPVLTIVASMKDDSDVSFSDLREAYNILAGRVRIKADASTYDVDAPVFRPLCEHHEAVARALERDLARCFIDPLHSQPSTHEQSHSEHSDVFGVLETPMSSSPVRESKKRGMSDFEIRYARDLYSVCHGALRLLSNLFAVPQLCNIFNGEELVALLTSLLAIPLAPSIPTPNSRKTYALAIFVLQTQRLPMDIIEPARPRITYAFSRAIEGELGKEGKKGSATDALKAVSEHLLSEPAVFLDSFVDLLPSILQVILSPNASIRTQCVSAFGSFVMAETTLAEEDEDKYRDTFATISLQVGNFIDKLFTDRPRDTGPDILSKALGITLANETLENKVTGPIWGACTLATVIVLSGGQLFRRTRTLKMVLSVMPHLTKHKHPAVKAIGRLVWRCLVWAFVDLQRAADQLPEGQPKREQQVSCDAAWKIVRQIVEGSVGLSIVIAVLYDGSARGVKRALEVIQVMLAGGSKSHQFATEMLLQLTSRTARRKCAMKPAEALLYCGLFDGNLMSFDTPTLNTTLHRIVKCVDPKHVRALSDTELAAAWTPLLALWKKSLLQTELCENDEIPVSIAPTDAPRSRLRRLVQPTLLDTWRNLLVAKTLADEDDSSERTDPDDATQERILALLLDILTGNSGQEIKLEQRLRIVCQLWQVAREVYSAEICASLSPNVLDELATVEISSEEALKPWAELTAALLVAGKLDRVEAWMTSSEMESDARQALWTALAREWANTEQSSFDGAIYLLSAPFGYWEMIPDDWETWDGMVAVAVQRGATLFIAANAVFDRICGFIGNSQNDLLALGEVTRHLLNEIKEDEPVPMGLFTAIGIVLEGLYPPQRSNLNDIIALINAVSSYLSSAPANMVLPFLDAAQAGLTVWIRDGEGILSTLRYTREIVPLYKACLEALAGVQLTLAHLDAYAELLASTFDRICPGAEGPAALQQFWLHVLREIPDVRTRCPEVLVPCLKSLAETYGEDLGVSVSAQVEQPAQGQDLHADADVEEVPEADIAMVDDMGDDSEAEDVLVEDSMVVASSDSWDDIDESQDARSVRQSRAASEVESEDELDWVHQTPSQSAGDDDGADVVYVDESSPQAGTGFADDAVALLAPGASVTHVQGADTAVPPRGLPCTPPRASQPIPDADAAFFLETSGASGSIVPSSVPLQDYGNPPRFAPSGEVSPSLVIASRSVLGKRARPGEAAQPDAGVRTVRRRSPSPSGSSVEDDSIVEDSLNIPEKRPAPRERQSRPTTADRSHAPKSDDVDSPISSYSSASRSREGSSRKKRVLEAVEMPPRLGSEEKGRHVLMSSLARAFLPLATTLHPSSQSSSQSEREAHPRARCRAVQG
ncbi:hypothetical protein AURDEDRAFT_181670 [Auricularia subglabra TFB-10046 SS5]|nr:hypothetical protein AURDEDRAFT_181670 [Auricularia subglabra TFB-10046 SS5]